LRLLLDTHALIWWLADNDHLGSRARALIQDPDNDVLVSIVSLWEIVLKSRIGKLEADIEEIWNAIESQGFSVLEIGAQHLLTLAKLPSHHRDPFDHLLIAQAIAEDAMFVSRDQHATRYPVNVISCAD
jgi:PIN domain nuclease of toxin-antitoxin system